MRVTLLTLVLFFTAILAACVDPEAILLRGTVDVIVVDGTLTNLPEPQIIRLNRSKADRLTGLFGTTPITKAIVEVVEDSSRTIPCHETVDGNYQLPGDFRGRVGHAYQLRFVLEDGRKYLSTQQVMPAVSAIDKVQVIFNPNSLSPDLFKGYTAAHDFLIDTQDPSDRQNYYRWDWKLWQKQKWCKTCVKGVYSVYKILPKVYLYGYYFVAGTELYEDCFTPTPGQDPYGLAPYVPDGHWYYDYICRTPCWEILYSYDINVFADTYTNGSLISGYRVAQVPFYVSDPGLVHIRQSSLTADAYRYYKQFQDQTQNTGGVADSPPAVPVGNVHNVNSQRENVVGYFTASAVSQVHYWLDRKDSRGLSLGASRATDKVLTDGEELHYALTGQGIRQEPPPPYQDGREIPLVRVWPTTNRPPTAPCVASDSRTPFKPEGWRE